MGSGSMCAFKRKRREKKRKERGKAVASPPPTFHEKKEEGNYKSESNQREHMEQMEPVVLKLRCRVSLNTGAQTVHMRGKSDRGATLASSEDHDYDFYLGAWMGLHNPHMDIQLLKEGEHGTAEASIKVPILSGDIDTVKFGVYVFDDNIRIARHLCSNFTGVQRLCDAIDGVSDYKDAKFSLSMHDNYTKNQALIHFYNDGTDLNTVRKLTLKSSIMWQNEHLNATVRDMTLGLHTLIEEKAVVTAANGGPGFVNSECWGQCQGCRLNYPLLGIIYSSQNHVTPLPLLSYMAAATIHYTHENAEELLRAGPKDFTEKYAIPLVKCFTACPMVVRYSGDVTLNLKGALTQPTEDFCMNMCKQLYIGVQDYHQSPYNLKAMDDQELYKHLVYLHGSKHVPATKGGLAADDCETNVGSILSIQEGILKAYIDNCKDSTKLGEAMWQCTRDMPNMRELPKDDFMVLGRLLHRVGSMHDNMETGTLPYIQACFNVVTAKGPSYDTQTANDLNGHACGLMQILDENGDSHYRVLEATTNLTMTDLPKWCPERVRVHLKDGLAELPTREVLATIGQNLSQMMAIDGKIRIEEQIPVNYKNPYNSCPFYMSSFFLNVKMGDCIPGMIPMEKKGDNNPLFGAPVACMNNSSAIPVNLADAMGEEHAKKFLDQIRQRNLECNPPRADCKTLERVASYWGHLDSIASVKSLGEDVWCVRTMESNLNSFINEGNFELKRRLAERFNAIQAADKNDDGARMQLSAYMLGINCNITVPLPKKDGTWILSSPSNLKQAISEHVAHTLKLQQLGAGYFKGCASAGNILKC